MFSKSRVPISILIALVVPCAPVGAQEPDALNLVVMLEWHDFTGVPHRGAGVILDQGEHGTLIVTAKHNLIDAVAGEPSQALTVEFRTRPGERTPAQVVDLSPSYDLGLVQVQAGAAPLVLGETAPSGVLNLEMGREASVFVVGYGGGRPWWHNRSPVPAHLPSVTRLVIESSEQQQGQSGGGVFDQDWALVGIVVATEGSLARALPIGLVLDWVGQTRFGVALAPSEDAVRNTARRELAGRHVQWNAASLGNALASVDVEVLNLFLRAGVGAELILEGLSQSAPGGSTAAHAFLQRSRQSQEAIAWLRGAMDAGLDPNGTVPSATFGRTGLLHVAIGTGNAPAALALLEGGATPHAFQELWFTRWPTPQMLLPFHAVIRQDGLTREEKQALIERMLANGGIVPNLEPVVTRRGEKYQTIAARELGEGARAHSGIQLEPTEHRDFGETPACHIAAARDGFDWCQFAREVPRGVRAEARNMLHDFWHLDLLGLIHAFEGRAYFLGLEKESYGEPLVLVEVSSDMRSWRVYRHMSPQSGMGLCREEDGWRPDHCWRRIQMTYHPEGRRMEVEGHYTYDVVWQ